MGSAAARWVLLATVLGSGVAFLDATVVNVALPAIAEDLDGSLADLQWVLNAYLVTLSALVLLGGSLGDRFGRRRVFLAGLFGFTGASVVCGLAPGVGVLIAARALQGMAAALLVPASLAILSATFHPDDRARAVGAWSGLSGVAGAVGPFVGGYLVDTLSWRVAFLVNVPLAAAVVVAVRHVPETRAADARRPDVPGALMASAGLGLSTYALIEAQMVVGVVGLLVLVAFVVVESRSPAPMLPLALFRNRQFSGANLTTLAVYAALSGAFFLLVLQLQVALGYSALEAGSALLPVTLLMVGLSARAGALAQRIGPRLPMTVGPVVMATGLLLWTRVDVGASYAGAVLPGALVFGLGLAATVAPLTATIMASADDEHLGAASGVNNAVARTAGLLAVSVLPLVVGLDTAGSPGRLDAAADDAMVVGAGLAVVGGLVALVTVRTAARVATTTQPNAAGHPCGDPCLRDAVGAPRPRRAARSGPPRDAG